MPKHWNPVGDFFKNHMTAVIRPVRSTYKNTAIGGRVAYVVDITLSSEEPEIIPIFAGDHEVQRFKSFRLTKESLASADALQQFLQQQTELGVLVCHSIEVVDVASWRTRERDFYKGKPVNARYAGYFSYKLVGRLATTLSDLRLKANNRAAQRQQHAKVDT
jgi:hypothetical protein